MKNRITLLRRCALGLLLYLIVIPSYGRINFSDLDLADDNRLLFTAHSNGGGSVSQSAVFAADIPSRSLSMLSTFPEKMELVNGGKTILVHNAFGSQQLPAAGGLPHSFPGFSAFKGSRVESSLASPDGRRLLFVEADSHARGTLVLLDDVSGKKIQVSIEVECPGRYFPAVWSADSRGFLYAKKGQLYYYSVLTEAPPPDEKYRIIGEGALPSLFWGSGETFYYLRSSTVYRVRSNELFARALYSSFLDLGEVAGKIPFNFDPNFDRFWVSPDGRSLLLCKDGRSLFYYPLGIQADTETDFASFPFIMTPRSLSRINVLWPGNGIATVIFTGPGTAESNYIAAYRLTIQSPGKGVFETLENPPAFEASLSPDGSRLLIWGKAGLYLYDYRSWKQLSRLVSQPVSSCLWLGNDEIVIGGEEKIESVKLRGNTAGERRLLCLSKISRYAFEADGSSASRRILAYSGTSWYATNGESPWAEVQTPSLRDRSIDSGRYRVYLENSGTFFENIPMIRNLTAVGTFPLFEQSNFVNYEKGGARQIALCFDLYDDAAGLSAVLDALNRYGVRATFFVNGEFIRRHPQAAKELAESGHEVASMFFAPIDLSDSRYRVDKTFIERGLARNEDEYYKTTGRELALLWHPPFYAFSVEIAAAAAGAGYRTTDRDVDCRDWIRQGDAKSLSLNLSPAADMIDDIMTAKKNGSIIPIRLGQLEGGRPDYLFNSMEVLLDALLMEGCEPVPVSTLLRNRN